MVGRAALVLAAFAALAPRAATAQPAVAAPTRLGLVPTGSTLEGGQVLLELNELGLWNRFSIGLTGRVELVTEVIGLGWMGSVGGRVQLSPPPSPVKLTVGAGVWGELVEETGADPVGHATASFGYHGPEALVFGNATLFVPSGQQFWLATGGIAVRVGDSSAVAALGGRMMLEPRGEAGVGAVGGAYKYTGRHLEFDIGLVFAGLGNQIVPLPLLGVSFRS